MGQPRLGGRPPASGKHAPRLGPLVVDGILDVVSDEAAHGDRGDDGGVGESEGVCVEGGGGGVLAGLAVLVERVVLAAALGMGGWVVGSDEGGSGE